MTPIGTPVAGAFVLTTVHNLPNVTMAFGPGTEKWSDRKASGAIVPGEAIVPVSSAGIGYWVKATGAASANVRQMAIALRTVDTPDGATRSQYTTPLGPNEIRNLTIASGDYVLACTTGAFHLTLIAENDYAPGDLIGWDPGATRQTGKDTTGSGAWVKLAANSPLAVFEVIQPFRPIPGETQIGVLTVKSLKAQF